MLKTSLNIILLVLLIFILKVLPAQDFTLTVIVENIREVKGKIQVGLFNSEEDFLEVGAEMMVASVDVDSSTVLIVFNQVPIGVYGISLYHDLNSSSEIDKNFIGFPVEPWGISNDAWRLLARPLWKDALFYVKENKTISIHLRH